MENTRPVDLSTFLDNGNPDLVLEAIRQLFLLQYPVEAFSPVETTFLLVRDLYEGRFPGYKACRTGYHDYRHSLDVFVATARLGDGCMLSGHPILAAAFAETLIAALLHDVGYVQEEGDDEGTGAKYTKIHVVRSAEFTVRHAARFGFSPEVADRIARIILGTDLALKWENIPYVDSAERYQAAILAAADLLGQMADRAYLEKLLFLYYEFKEAGIGGYEDGVDILRKTSSFYVATKDRLDRLLGDVSYAARLHFKIRHRLDEDLYRDAIERQMAYLDSIMEANSADYRKRLRRLDVTAIEREEEARLARFGVQIPKKAG